MPEQIEAGRATTDPRHFSFNMTLFAPMGAVFHYWSLWWKPTCVFQDIRAISKLRSKIGVEVLGKAIAVVSRNRRLQLT